VPAACVAPAMLGGDVNKIPAKRSRGTPASCATCTTRTEFTREVGGCLPCIFSFFLFFNSGFSGVPVPFFAAVPAVGARLLVVRALAALARASLAR
jgi:hypothetical protein